jgi:hypothetical protein
MGIWCFEFMGTVVVVVVGNGAASGGYTRDIALAEMFGCGSLPDRHGDGLRCLVGELLGDCRVDGRARLPGLTDVRFGQPGGSVCTTASLHVQACLSPAILLGNNS